MDYAITALLILCGISSIITVAVMNAVQNIWVKRDWSETARPVVLGLGFIVMLMITVVPGMLLIDKIYKSINVQPVTVIDIPEVESVPYRRFEATFTDDDEHCLALNIYFEARGEEELRGKYAVADVVMYRYMHADYPNTVCDVVQEGYYHEWRPDLPVKHKCQFSWFCDGKSDKPLNTQAFEEAIDIAQEVLHNGDYEPRVGFSLFYHANTVNPHWASKMNHVETIGNHSFYRY